jgi:hypothetical protein
MTKIKAPVENFETMFQNLKNSGGNYKNFLSLELSNDQRRLVILYLIEILNDDNYDFSYGLLETIIAGDINHEFSDEIESSVLEKLDLKNDSINQYNLSKKIIINFPQRNIILI